MEKISHGGYVEDEGEKHRKLRHRQSTGLTCIGAQNAWSAGIRYNPDAPAFEKRLVRQRRRDIEHFVETLGAYHAGLPEQRIDSHIVRSKRGGVRAGGAPACQSPAGLYGDDWFRPADTP